MSWASPDVTEPKSEESWRRGAVVLVLAAVLGACLYLWLRAEPGTAEYYGKRFGWSCDMQSAPIGRASPSYAWRKAAQSSGTVTCPGMFPALTWARFETSNDARVAVAQVRGPRYWLLCSAGRDAMAMGVVADEQSEKDFREMCADMNGALSSARRS